MIEVNGICYIKKTPYNACVLNHKTVTSPGIYHSFIISRRLTADKTKIKSFIMDSERYWGEKKGIFTENFTANIYHILQSLKQKKHPEAANARYSC